MIDETFVQLPFLMHTPAYSSLLAALAGNCNVSSVIQTCDKKKEEGEEEEERGPSTI
jgi:hypothetical protein